MQLTLRPSVVVDSLAGVWLLGAPLAGAPLAEGPALGVLLAGESTPVVLVAGESTPEVLVAEVLVAAVLLPGVPAFRLREPALAFALPESKALEQLAVQPLRLQLAVAQALRQEHREPLFRHRAPRSWQTLQPWGQPLRKEPVVQGLLPLPARPSVVSRGQRSSRQNLDCREPVMDRQGEEGR